MNHEESGTAKQDAPKQEWCPGENEEAIQTLLNIFHQGNYRHFEQEINSQINNCKNHALKLRLLDLLNKNKPDKINVLIGISTVAFFLIIALSVIVPHGQVLVARQLTKSIETGDLTRSRLLFTAEGWEENGGRELVESMNGRQGRTFSPSKGGREHNYLRVEFATRHGNNNLPEDLEWNGTYLLFVKSGNQWRIGRIQTKKPTGSLTAQEGALKHQRPAAPFREGMARGGS